MPPTPIPVATVNITVNPAAATNSDAWDYQIGDSTAKRVDCESLFATVPEGDQGVITLNIASSNSGFTVAFQSAPLLFDNGNPSWYEPQPMASGSTQAVIIDNNSLPPAATTTYRFRIQATATTIGSNPVTTANITSPDPTIINVGTGGEHSWFLPEMDRVVTVAR